MAATVLQPADLFDFDALPLPRPNGARGTGPGNIGNQSMHHHAKVGTVVVGSLGLSHMHVLDMHWTLTHDLELRSTDPSNTVDINFALTGSMHSRFKGLAHDLPMRAGTHNLIHTPEPGQRSQLAGGQTFSNLLISLDRRFFADSIGSTDAWSERVLNDLEHERPFSGISGAAPLTPAMISLINDIRHCPATGPMRNLLIQSRVLELLALEIDQFRTPTETGDVIPPDEAEKLYRLKAYLDDNFLAEHSLAHLSRYCVLNEFKVKKGFRHLFGTTIFTYLRELRMEHAGRLLRHYSLSVDEVADRLGYEHAQHFSVAFKKYTGQTPTHYQYGRAR